MSTNKNSALAKLVIDELSPLLQQTEKLVTEIQAAHSNLKNDLDTYHALTQHKALPTLATKQDIHLAIQSLESKIKAKMMDNHDYQEDRPPQRWKIYLLLAAVIVVGITIMIGIIKYQSLTEDAKLGQQFKAVYPYLDEETKGRIKTAIEKATAK